jgi:hypothetical protein
MPKPNSGQESKRVDATVSDVHHILGQTNDSTALAVLALHPSVAQLEEARVWLDGAGEVLGKAHRPLDGVVYPYALRTRKSAGLMTRKLSVTESQKTAQFFGTSTHRKCRTDRQKSL